MLTVAEILNHISKLSVEEQEKIKSILLSSEFVSSICVNELVTNDRFANGRTCPICGGIHIVRNGRRSDGTQRFICRDCNKSFVATTNSIVSGTKKDLSVWEKYISCVMSGMSIRKTAEVCNIHRNTAFYWRHKILDALQEMIGDVELSEIVEADETFLRYRTREITKNCSTFVMPRKAHKRCGETHTRWLSYEKVCVPCAVNRKGLSIARISNLGRVSIKDLCNVFDGRINSESFLVTDKSSSYIKFADENNLKLIQLKNGRDKNGIYNIQHINNYHSLLKRFMRNFNGVSTKYSNNYLAWHNFMNYSRESNLKNETS